MSRAPISATRETRRIPNLPDVEFIEADGDRETFSPCHTSSPAVTGPLDEIIFHGKSVRSDDPEFLAYIERRGASESRTWRASGRWEDIEWNAERAFVWAMHMRRLRNCCNANGKLESLSYIERIFGNNYPLRFFRGEQEVRDAVIYALQNDCSEKVRVRAVSVLSVLSANGGRFQDAAASAAIHEAMRDGSHEVRKEAVRSRLLSCKELVDIYSNPDENIEIRELAVATLWSRIDPRFQNPTEIIWLARGEGPFEDIAGRRLQIAALGTIIGALYPFVQRRSVKILPASDRHRAMVAKTFLQNFADTTVAGFFESELFASALRWARANGYDITREDVVAVMRRDPTTVGL